MLTVQQAVFTVESLISKVQQQKQLITHQQQIIEQLLKENKQLRKENEQLKYRVQELEARTKKNSSNSHLPPSSDRFHTHSSNIFLNHFFWPVFWIIVYTDIHLFSPSLFISFLKVLNKAMKRSLSFFRPLKHSRMFEYLFKSFSYFFF